MKQPPLILYYRGSDTNPRNVQGYLLNIPGWDWRRDDQAVCLNEIKYGMLAQSVLAQGFFTLAGELYIIKMK